MGNRSVPLGEPILLSREGELKRLNNGKIMREEKRGSLIEIAKGTEEGFLSFKGPEPTVGGVAKPEKRVSHSEKGH